MEALIEKINESYLIKFIVDNNCVDVYAVDTIKIQKEEKKDEEMSFSGNFNSRSE